MASLKYLIFLITSLTYCNKFKYCKKILYTFHVFVSDTVKSVLRDCQERMDRGVILICLPKSLVGGGGGV